MSDPTSRALALLSLLQTHRHWTGGELSDRLNVSERTVRRDIDRLRELGYPVDAEPGVDGGYRLAVGSNVPPLLVSDEEAVALVIGLRGAAASAIEGIEDTTVELLGKLDRMMPDRLRRRVGALANNVEVMNWAPATATIPAEALTVLSQACSDHEEVRFGYQRRDGEESSRLVRPHQLVTAGRRWYLVCWDVRREDWRTFRLDRMTSPALAGARFDAMDLPAESAAAFVFEGMQAMTEQHQAVVIVTASAEHIVGIARRFHGDVEPIDEHRARVLVSSDSLEWLASMIAILAMTSDVQLVEVPDPVRSLLATAAMRLTIGATN